MQEVEKYTEPEATDDDLSAFKEANASMFVSEVIPETPEWSFPKPDQETQLLIQEALTEIGLYTAKLNGDWQRLSIVAIQEVVGAQITGEASEELETLVKRYVNYSETQELDQNAWEAFLVALEFGKETTPDNQAN